jgi:hypothetical protein
MEEFHKNTAWLFQSMEVVLEIIEDKANMRESRNSIV